MGFYPSIAVGFYPSICNIPLSQVDGPSIKSTATVYRSLLQKNPTKLGLLCRKPVDMTWEKMFSAQEA